ncbi:CHAT domain-containing protein [Exophiala viscosa]|uniref:CHAT domain-containing protein n=1 Tax=Exophiala viscosa TaxID=2486360 RepID=A0AAN6DPM1_9EURO|nr:CHAT domain-containing protein [Exophiala viscosa]
MEVPDEHSATSITRYLEDARALSRLGRYSAAIGLLNEARRHHADDLALLFELAETHATQGYINRAHALLTENASVTGLAADMLQMLKCFLEPVISGRFSRSVAEAEDINQKYQPEGSTDPDWIRIATIRLYHFKMFGLYSVFHHADGTSRARGAEVEVMGIIEHLLDRGDVLNAFKFCNVLLNSEDKVRSLSSILAMKELPSLIKAKAQLELAGLSPGPEHKQHREGLRQSARTIFTQEQHHHGALDADLAEALEDPTPSCDLDIGRLLQSYEKLDYPNGLKSWLNKLLDVAERLHNCDLQRDLEQTLEDLATKTGTLCLLKVGQVNLIARFHQKTGNDNLIKTALQKLYQDLTNFDLPYTLGHVGFILTDIFIQYRNAPEALKWARICEIHWKACLPATQSMGALQVLRTRIMECESRAGSEYQLVLEFAQQLVDSDLAGGLHEEAAMKLDTIVGLYFTCTTIQPQERNQQIPRLFARIEEMLEMITDRDMRLQKAGLLQRKATFHMSLGSQYDHCILEQGALEAFQEALDLTHAATKGTLAYQLVAIRGHMGLVRHTCFTKTKRSNREESKSFLDAAAEDFRVCLTGYEAISSTFQIAETKYWIALLKYEAWTQNWESYNPVIQALLDAEAGYDDRRDEINISSGLSAIKDKQALAKEKHVRDIYRFAFQICAREGHAADAWHWVQKAKARSLSDMLGLGCLMPEALQSLVWSDPTSREHYEREKELLQMLRAVPPDRTFAVGLELRQLQKKMRSMPTLKALLDLRQGKAVTADELTTRWETLPVGHQKVVFIDWYVLGAEDIYILMLQRATEPVLQKLALSVSQVRSWINTFLVAEEGQEHSLRRMDGHENQALRELDGLVEIIGEHVAADILLVLSPAAPLDALPLHALHVRPPSTALSQRRMPLIERNPLVYCSNMTVFLQCCELAATKKPQGGLKTTFMAVYEGTPTEECDMAEQQAVYRTMKDLATKHKTSATTGLNVTREIVSTEWASSDYILFHGHCDMSSQDITKQSLLLRQTPPDGEDTTFSSLSVIDIFGMKLRSPLVCLLACGSSQQRIEAGDEPLGLVTALLCAGTASVIGTLWPVASGTARLFATGLAETMKLAEPPSQGEPSALSQAIDLTVVLQQTVRKLKHNNRTRTPYHWAAFVLHGSTFLRARSGSPLLI